MSLKLLALPVTGTVAAMGVVSSDYVAIKIINEQIKRSFSLKLMVQVKSLIGIVSVSV